MMLSRSLVTAVMVLAMLFPATASGNDKAERLDAFGDPLPPEAVRRIGSIHFRPGAPAHTLIACPDGKTLISDSAQCDSKVCVWELATGRLSRQFSGSWDRRSIALSPNGAILATIPDDTIHLWDFASGRELRRLKGHRFGTFGLAFAPDSKTLASCGPDDIRLWDAATGAEIAVLPWKRRPISINCLLAFSPDGKTLIAGQMFDGKIHLWDVAARRERGELTREGGMLAMTLAVSSDGKLATGGGNGRGSGDGLIPIWDLATGEVVRRLHSEQKYIGSVAFSPDGKWLASAGGQSGSIWTTCLWDLSTGKVRHSWKSFTSSLTFSRDSKILIAGGSVIRRWEVASGEEIQPKEGNALAVYTLALSPDGRKLACRSEGIHLREADTGKLLHRLAPEDEKLSDCAFSPDGKTLATVSYDGILHLWDVADGKTLRRVEVPLVGQPVAPSFKRDPLVSIAFAPDGKTLATSSRQGTVSLWNAPTGESLHRFSQRLTNIDSVAFSADGKRVYAATWTREGTDVRVWEVAEVKELPQLTVAINAQMLKSSSTDRFNGSNFARLTLSRDGRMLAINREKTISIWETATGKERLRLKGHAEPTVGIVFSPDGRLFASTGRDATMKLWDLTTGTELAQLSGHRGQVRALVFSPDGKRLYSGGDDTSVLVSDVTRFTEHGLPAVAHVDAQSAWNDLAADDAARAYRAICALRANPETALPLLSKHLQPAAAVNVKRLDELIHGLDADEFAVRDAAARELEKQGESAEPALRRALGGTPALEVRRRIDQLLEKLVCPDGDMLRQLRAVEVLEHLGSPEARQLLRKLAGGAAEARLTCEAKAALDRFNPRK